MGSKALVYELQSKLSIYLHSMMLHSISNFNKTVNGRQVQNNMKSGNINASILIKDGILIRSYVDQIYIVKEIVYYEILNSHIFYCEMIF